MATVTVDTSELRRFAGDLDGADKRVVVGARAVLETSTTALREDMKRTAREGQRHAPSRIRRFPETISSEVRGLESETGPERRGQGNLAAIFYFGGSRGGAVIENPAENLARVVPEFLAGLAKVADEAALKR